MDNNDYEEIVQSERELIPDRVYFLKTRLIDSNVKCKVWLLVTGLIETWDMTKCEDFNE